MGDDTEAPKAPRLRRRVLHRGPQQRQASCLSDPLTRRIYANLRYDFGKRGVDMPPPSPAGGDAPARNGSKSCDVKEFESQPILPKVLKWGQ